MRLPVFDIINKITHMLQGFLVPYVKASGQFQKNSPGRGVVLPQELTKFIEQD
jgi:hypothetical protein